MTVSDENQGISQFQVAGLLGQDIGYSLSPTLHEIANQASGRRCDYQLFDVRPEHLSGFLKRIIEYGEIVGMNITTPYKVAMAGKLDAVQTEARETGAVNVVGLRGDHLIGYNTDRPAMAKVIRAALSEGEHDRYNWTVVLLGIGGAARAMAWALADTGIIRNLIVVSRSKTNATDFLSDIRRPYYEAKADVSIIEWSELNDFSIAAPAMLINATPLGCISANGRVLNESPNLPPGSIQRFELVIDLIYNPPETGLMKAAALQGIHTVGGGGLLVEQAALSRSIWFGKGKEDIERIAMTAGYVNWVKKITQGEAN
ncbi:MAG: hypothetical protein ABIC40_01385 [bacterium]